MHRIFTTFLVALSLVLASAAVADVVKVPPADGIEVRPTLQIFSHFEYNMSGYEDYDPRFDTNDHNRFDLTRLWAGADASLTQFWSARFVFGAIRENVVTPETAMVDSGVADDPNTPDVDESQTEVMTGLTQARTGRLTAAMMYAYARYKPFSWFAVDFGSIESAYIPTIYKFWGHRYIMPAMLDQYRLARNVNGDLGVGLGGEFPSGFGSWRLAVTNGEGKLTGETNAGKAVEGHLRVYPLAMTADALKGLGFMVYYNYDKQEPDFAELTNTTIDAVLGYRYDINEATGFSVNGEYARRTTESGDEKVRPLITGSDLNPMESTAYAVWADFRFLTRYGVLARYDFFDPNTENDKDKLIGYQDEQTLLLAGLWCQPITPVWISVNYRTVSYTAEIVDDKGKDVKMQPDQMLFVNTQVRY